MRLLSLERDFALCWGDAVEIETGDGYATRRKARPMQNFFFFLSCLLAPSIALCSFAMWESNKFSGSDLTGPDARLYLLG